MSPICLIFSVLGIQCSTGPQSTLNYSPYYKGPVCTPASEFVKPTSLDQVQEVVRFAINNGKTVKAVGIRHSATDVICTNGIPLDMTGMVGMGMNPDQTVTVEPGVTLRELAEFLKSNGRGLKTTPAYGAITIGGAIGTGAHGSSIKYPSSISEHVIAVVIIDGNGDLQTIVEGNPDLAGFRVHLGLLGIVVSITLRTEPLYKVQGHNTVVSDQMLFDGTFIDTVRQADQMSLYWFPSLSKIVMANWTIVDVDTPGEAITNDHVPSTNSVFNTAADTALNTAYESEDLRLPDAAYTTMHGIELLSYETLFRLVPTFAPIYTYDTQNMLTFANPAVGYYHEMFAPICNDTGFWQCPWKQTPALSQLDNEFSVATSHVPALVQTVKDIITKYPAAFPVQGILMRFSAPSETYMSAAYQQETCHFEFYMPMRPDLYDKATPGLAAYQTILQTMMLKYGGKSHWGKSGAVYHNRQNLDLNLDAGAKQEFLNLMNKYDPNGVFLNDFGHRLRGDSDANDIDPQALAHCALLDNCICSKDSDCAAGQVCSSIAGYSNTKACITKKLLSGILG